MKKLVFPGGTLFVSSGDTFTVLPYHGECDGIASEIGGAVLCPECEWNRDLPPWDAPGLYADGDSFEGGADAFLSKLTDELIPRCFEMLGYEPKRRIIAGYSMSGLFAAYAATKTDMFSMAACVSPSLWFDGFTDYFENAVLFAERMYFSVGRKEKNTRNARMAEICGLCEKARDIAASKGAEAVFELNNGGHFTDPDGRTVRGIKWLSGRTDG